MRARWKAGCRAASLAGLLAGLLARGDDVVDHPVNQHPNGIGRMAPEFVVSDGTQTVDLEQAAGEGGGAEPLGDVVRAVSRSCHSLMELQRESAETLSSWR